MKKYDVAAYIWPSYTGKEPRSLMFWEKGYGEWQTVEKAEPRFPGHLWPRKPLWGTVDEADPDVMEMQIKEAASHGVNVFIYDWYWYDGRPFLEQCLDDGFLGAKNRSDMKFYLMWANHDALYLWDKRNSENETCIWRGQVSDQEFENVTNRVIEKYFSQPEYYKINGKPVFMIYDIMNLIKGLGGIERTKQKLEEFRAKTVKAGFPGLELQMTIWSDNAVNLSGVDSGHTGNSQDVVRLLGFDSVSHYQYIHFVPLYGNTDYNDVMPLVKKEWEHVTETYDVPYYPHVSIGWDNNPRHNVFMPGVIVNNTPDNFKKALLEAKKYVDEHDLPANLITINSWNEWTEGSYLEPDDINGYGYLDAVKDVFLS